jgi:hypothetical protein
MSVIIFLQVCAKTQIKLMGPMGMNILGDFLGMFFFLKQVDFQLIQAIILTVLQRVIR